tara:strand:- start:166 stop:525 length:360 start_codon:yes stop_codon:yes gene_type:complete
VYTHTIEAEPARPKINIRQLEDFIEETTDKAVDKEISKHVDGIHEHIDYLLTPVVPKIKRRRISVEHRPYPYGYAHPGIMPYHAGAIPYAGFGGPAPFTQAGYGYHGGMPFGAHHGYPP